MANDHLLDMTLAGASDTGRRRRNNEDAVWWNSAETEEQTQHVMVVADGMGGAAGGEVASQIAIDECRREFASSIAASEVSAALRRTIEQANAAVHQAAEERVELHGMGTTVTAAVITNGELYVGHVGDSRCYVVGAGESRQITEDHTWVAEEIRSGRLDPSEAGDHRARHALSRTVGVNPAVEVDVYGPFSLSDEDVVLVCSDGLYEVVDPQQIVQLAEESSISELPERLVALANEAGGPDNVSVVAAKGVKRKRPPLAPESAGAATAAAGTGPRAEVTPGRTGGGGSPPPALPFGMGPVMWLGVGVFVAGLLFALYLAFESGDGGESGLVASPTGAVPTEATEPGSSTPTPPVVPGSVTCNDGREAFEYEVKSGDTISAIAADNGLTAEDILDCDSAIEDPTLIQVGQPIRIPCPDESCP